MSRMLRRWGGCSPLWVVAFAVVAISAHAQRPASRTTGGTSPAATTPTRTASPSSGRRREQARTRIAVEGFSGPRASHLRSLVIANLEENNFEIVDSDDVDAAKREADVDGAMNTAEEYVEVARVARIDAFISGHVGRQRRSWSLGVRVRNGGTGAPIGGASWGGRTTSAMDGVRRNCSERLWEHLGEAHAPAQISARERDERARRERETQERTAREAAEAERREREEEEAEQSRRTAERDRERDERDGRERDERDDERSTRGSRDDEEDERPARDDERDDRSRSRDDERADRGRDSERRDRDGRTRSRDDEEEDEGDDRDGRDSRDRRSDRSERSTRERSSSRRRQRDDCDPRYDDDCDEEDEPEELPESETRYDSFRLAIATGSLYRDFGGTANVYAARRGGSSTADPESIISERRHYGSAGIGHAELGVDAEIYPGAFNNQTFPYLGFFGSFRHSLFLSARGQCRDTTQCMTEEGTTLVSANSLELQLGARIRYRFGRNRRDFEMMIDGSYGYNAFNFDLEGLAKLNYDGIVAPMEYQGISVGGGFNYGVVPRYLFLSARLDYRIGLALGVNARNVWGVSSSYDNGLHMGMDLKHEVSWLDPNLFVTLRLEYFFFQTRFRGQVGCYTAGSVNGRCDDTREPWLADANGAPNLWERWPVRPGSTDYYADESVAGAGGFENAVMDHYFRLGIILGYAFR